jgi:hypothetical protein
VGGGAGEEEDGGEGTAGADEAEGGREEVLIWSISTAGIFRISPVASCTVT